MEPKWTIVKRKTSKASRQGQKTSLVQSAKAKEVKEEMREEEMWREEDFDKPDFLFKVSPKLTRGEKKKRRPQSRPFERVFSPCSACYVAKNRKVDPSSATTK